MRPWHVLFTEFRSLEFINSNSTILQRLVEAAVTGTITMGREDKAGGDRRGETAAQQDKAVDPKQAKCPCINGIFFPSHSVN